MLYTTTQFFFKEAVSFVKVFGYPLRKWKTCYIILSTPRRMIADKFVPIRTTERSEGM